MATAATAQTNTLSREEASRQISIVLKNTPVIKKLSLTISLEFFPRFRSPTQLDQYSEQDNKEYVDYLMKTLTAPDSPFSISLPSRFAPDNSRNSVTGRQDFQELREAWKAGLIDHFDIDVYARSGSIEGTVKENQRTLCSPERGEGFQSNLWFCNLLVAQKKVDKVTGITSAYTQNQIVKVVEFDERIEPTDAGKMFDVKAEVHPARAFFLLYDDGWRIGNILD
jgi:hypothetical protein